MSSFHTLYECDALVTPRYLFLGPGRLDSEVRRKTHPKSVLALSKAIGLG